MSAIVSQSEAHLLLIARSAVGLVPIADVMRLFAASVSPPGALGPTARRLLADGLARGTVLALARHGGWRPGLGGRLWERRAAPPLHFTGAIVRLFQWMLRTPLGDAEPTPLASRTPFTLAESIVVTLLIDQLRGTGWNALLARQPAVRATPLVVLAHIVELAAAGALEEVPSFDVDGLEVPVEGLRTLLARCWVAGERFKRDVSDPAVLRRVGEAQEAVLSAFLAKVDGSGKRGLATFLVDAAAEWFRHARSGADVSRALSPDAPLRDRSEARRAAGAFLRALATIDGWDRAHRVVHFVDDGYAEAQALVKEWERLGQPGFQRARTIVEELEALPTAAPAAAS